MTDAELNYAITYQHFKCLGELHSERCFSYRFAKWLKQGQPPVDA